MREIKIHPRVFAGLGLHAFSDAVGFFGCLGASVAVDLEINFGTLLLGFRHQSYREFNGIFDRRVVIGELAVDGALIEGKRLGDTRREVRRFASVEESTVAQPRFGQTFSETRSIDSGGAGVESRGLDGVKLLAGRPIGAVSVLLVGETPEVGLKDESGFGHEGKRV